jgi:MtN3 and saliva related transmembrane protein
MAELFGILATIISGGLDIPQVFKTYKTKDVKSFAFSFLFLRWVIMILWLIYGLMIHNDIITASNIICLFWTSIMLIFYFKYRKN